MTEDQTLKVEDVSLVDLLCRARSGDADANREFFDRTFGRLLRMLRASGMRANDEDCAQQALIEIVNPQRPFEARSDGSILKYLQKVAKGRWINQQSKYVREVSVGLDLQQREDVSTEAGGELADVLCVALGSVNPTHRATLALYCTHSKKKTVGDLLGIDEATVRWRINSVRSQVVEYIRVNHPEIYSDQRRYFEPRQDDNHE